MSETEGFKFLGRELYSVQEQLHQKAEKLYRGKVLIDRERTRDLLAAQLAKKPLKLHMLNQEQKSNMRKISEHVDSKLPTTSRKERNKMQNYHTEAMTSRFRETTQMDSDHPTDELLSSKHS